MYDVLETTVVYGVKKNANGRFLALTWRQASLMSALHVSIWTSEHRLRRPSPCHLRQRIPALSSTGVPQAPNISAAPPPNTTSVAIGLLATRSSTRCCQTASSGGRSGLFFDPDFKEPPEIRCDVEPRQQARQGVERELRQLAPERAVEHGLENGHQHLGRSVHIERPVAPVPRPDPHLARHGRKTSTSR